MQIKAVLVEKFESLKHNQKGQALGLNALYGLVLTLSIVAILIIIVRRILVRFYVTDGSVGAEENNDTITSVLGSLDEITDWFVIIVGVVIGVVVLIVLIRALAFLRQTGATSE